MIIDASAFLEFLFRTDAGRQVDEVFSGEEEVVAPELFDAEVLHRLLQMGHAGRLTAGEVEVAVADLRDAPIRRLSHRPLLAEATRLGAALSGHDALYVAAAMIMHQPLWTADRRLASTARHQFNLD